MKGFSLIECILFIVVMAVGVISILSVFSQLVSTGTDPIAVQQAAWIADAYLQEITSKPVINPVTGAVCDLPGPTDRTTFNKVCDYRGYFKNSLVTDQNGNPISGLSDYQLTVTITNLQDSGLLWQAINDTVFQIDLLVQHPNIPDLKIRTYRTPYS